MQLEQTTHLLEAGSLVLAFGRFATVLGAIVGLVWLGLWACTVCRTVHGKPRLPSNAGTTAD